VGEESAAPAADAPSVFRDGSPSLLGAVTLTLLTLVPFYGPFALVDGVLAVIAAIKGGAPAPRWWLAIVGILGS
jgi:uncharacterized membrane protein HdeD (DUF308 family)